MPNHSYTFPCGHRKMRKNQTSDGRCRPCLAERTRQSRAKTISEKMRAVANVRYANKDTAHFRCGHDRTPKNTATGATPFGTCRQCKAERDKNYGRRGGKASAAAKKVIRLDPVVLRDFAPRPLPTHDDSGRSYGLAPSRRFA